MFGISRPPDLQRHRALSCGALLLIVTLTLVVHISGGHECVQRPCGILLAHGGVALTHSGAPPLPPPLEATLALLDRPSSPRHIEAEPLRHLRAPPEAHQEPPARPV